MGVKALKIGDLEREVAVKIRDAVDAAGWTPAQLAREASITKARVYTLLDSESPMTITTFAAMCRALGLTASEVVREAEEAVARAEGSAVVEPASGGAEVVDWRTEAARVRAERERGARIAASMAAAAQHIDDSVDDDNANV